MSAIRPFEPLDLLRLNSTNLDNLTENYDITFYLTYLAKWPSLFQVIEGPNGEIQGYSIHPSPSTSSHLSPTLS